MLQARIGLSAAARRDAVRWRGGRPSSAPAADSLVIVGAPASKEAQRNRRGFPCREWRNDRPGDPGRAAIRDAKTKRTAGTTAAAATGELHTRWRYRRCECVQIRETNNRTTARRLAASANCAGTTMTGRQTPNVMGNKASSDANTLTFLRCAAGQCGQASSSVSDRGFAALKSRASCQRPANQSAANQAAPTATTVTQINGNRTRG